MKVQCMGHRNLLRPDLVFLTALKVPIVAFSMICAGFRMFVMIPLSAMVKGCDVLRTKELAEVPALSSVAKLHIQLRKQC